MLVSSTNWAKTFWEDPSCVPGCDTKMVDIPPDMLNVSDLPNITKPKHGNLFNHTPSFRTACHDKDLLSHYITVFTPAAAKIISDKNVRMGLNGFYLLFMDPRKRE